MDPEKKDAPPVEKKEDVAPEPTVEKEKTQEELQIDYKAELEREKKAREKAERELADRAFKEREAKRSSEDPDPDPDEKPITAKDLESLETRIYQKAQKELQATRINEVARGLAAGNDDLAALIIETHKNRIFPSNLSVEEQLQESYAIVHGRKNAAKVAELARALNSRQTSSKTDPTSHHDSPTEEPRLSGADAHALKEAGLTWDPMKRAYKKPISGGKKYYYFDPKTKKRWTA